MDYEKIDNIEFENIDYGDFCDAFISSANYDGIAMTDDQLDELNDDTSFVYEKLMEHLL